MYSIEYSVASVHNSNIIPTMGVLRLSARNPKVRNGAPNISAHVYVSTHKFPLRTVGTADSENIARDISEKINASHPAAFVDPLPTA